MELVGKASRALRVLRYGAVFGWEQLTGYCPTDPEKAPASAAKIAPSWVDGLLCKDTRGARITDIVMVVSALSIEDRRAWGRDLLKRCRERLREQNVSDLPGGEEIWDEYRRQTFHPLYFWLTTIGAGVLQPDMQPNHISLGNLKRMGQAIVDLDSMAVMRAVM